ncbi:hypothetical protein GCM10023354_12210 [Garicola koreensis]|uniref:hypothetical protein n=1 Tax=Garicola koreensis TaxID=1262554 RepID=UPI0031ED3284
MTEHESPFDDPDVKAAMAKIGAVHRPGLADEMMEEMAPLLAEEGVDLNDPDADFDLDQLNAAMSYATERHNMQLFTPVGSDRAHAHAALREISDAVAGGDTAQAERILDSIQPDATAHRPSNAQLIGAALDLLDAWHSAEDLRSALSAMSVPRWLGTNRKAARDLLALARKGRAYSSLDKLMLSHGGLAVAHGSALLVAATLVKLADHQRVDFSQVLDRHLPSGARGGGEPPRKKTSSADPAPEQGSAFGPAVAAAVSKQNLVTSFSTWLAAEGQDPAPLREAKVALFEATLDEAATDDIDPSTPEGFTDLVEMNLALYSGSQLDMTLDLLHDYVHFQLDADEDPDGWAEAHADIAEETVDDDGPAALMAALNESREMDENVRRAALAQTRIVSAVGELLSWLGKSQPITPSGVPRRADIEPLAAMLGISAQGVAKRPPYDTSELESQLPAHQRPTTYVQSALEVPELTAWWVALQEADVIELTSTRVRPGPEAAAFTGDESTPVEQSENLLSAFVFELLIHDLAYNDSSPSSVFDRALVSQTVARLLSVAVPDVAITRPENEGVRQMLQWSVTEKLHGLEAAGVVQMNEDEPIISPALRGPVIRGLMVAAGYVSDLEGATR